MKSQSYIYSKTKKNHNDSNIKVEKKSQSRRYLSENTINVIFYNKEYWVKDNTFFSADIVNDKIDRENAYEIKTEKMSKEDIDKMLFILDRLKGDSK